MTDYHINVFWSEEDACWVADIPDLVSCSALGTTPQEAVEQVGIAKEAWLEAAAAEGTPIPAPTYRPLIYQVSAWRQHAALHAPRFRAGDSVWPAGGLSVRRASGRQPPCRPRRRGGR